MVVVVVVVVVAVVVVVVMMVVLWWWCKVGSVSSKSNTRAWRAKCRVALTGTGS
jgi:hypothetical protein